jgi:voltage-gated potassium channel
MLKNLIKILISDEIHHPILTKGYRVFIVFNVISLVLFSILITDKNFFLTFSPYKDEIFFYFYFVLFLDFILRFIGSYYQLDVTNEFEKGKYHAIKSYIFSFYGLVDFICALFFVGLFYINDIDIFVSISLFSFLKLARYSPALVILKDVVVNERKTLLSSLYVMFILTISTSALLYFVERDYNDGFKSLLDSMWWSIITLSTVGYGDVVPHTYMGKILGSIAAISGFGMFALPAGILANGFASEVKRLQEVVSWSMVAKVPLFSSLDEAAIYDIAALLRVKRFRKKEVIIQEGMKGEYMYFIMEGSVKVFKKNFSTVLYKDDFFGEIALVKDIPRVATVVANENCKLLELSRYDFQNLIANKPELLKEIERVAKQRYDS